MSFRRGARPSPRHRLAAATPHKALAVVPAQHLVVPSTLSMWLNQTDGDCVTAEEAFNKACDGILIADATVQAWASTNNVLNGADLDQVLTLMQSAGFSQDGNMYNDGAATSVDWTTQAVLQSALSQGRVKIGVAADQLEALQSSTSIGVANGWVATGFKADSNEDHCVSLCGYGTIAWLAQLLGGSVPSGVDGTQIGYAMFTWSTIGIIDEPSLLAITGEAWLRSPTTKIVGTGTPAPDVVTTYPAPAPTPPATGPATLSNAQAWAAAGIQGGDPLQSQDDAIANAIAGLAKYWPSGS